MVKEHAKMWALIFALVLLIPAAVSAQTPADAVADAVANSGDFPVGTTVVSVTVDGASAVVDLSAEAVAGDFGDTQSDAMVKAIVNALGEFPEINAIEVTVAGAPLWQYLPPSSAPDGGSGGPTTESWGAGQARLSGGIGVQSAQDPLLPPSVPSLTSELAGKLVVLHPSHGSYVYNTTQGWYRSMRTYSGPNPRTNPPPLEGAAYQPSDYYYWTRGFQWPMYYEDEMAPETIRFLYAYCQSAGAATYCSRNLDKTAGNFPASWGGYPNKGTAYGGYPVPKWRAATKYNLQDIGVPEWVWNEPSLSAQSDKDLRARPYYANYLMESLGYTKDNSVSFSLHSNAANTGTNPPGFQAQARGTETYWYVLTGDPYGVKTQAVAYCTAVETGVINAIRNQYDGTWAESQYSAVLTPIPPEWFTTYGTYRGYVQDGTTLNRWQDRGVKTTNFGEIREAKMPAQLMELLFHDDWKFYPDQAFHQDKIFRATVAWGMYVGICNYFGVTPKARLAASVDSVSFPAFVLPNTAISGTVTMKNLGQAWCWGDKMVGTVYGPYTVWDLQATADDQFGAAGTKIAIANDGNYYPGDTAAFDVSLTSPAASGYYTTSWQMLKDDGKGGSFGDIASATIGVDGDAPVITITAPEAKWYNGDPVTVSFSATDAMSGVAGIVADVDGTAVNSGDSVPGLATGSHTLTVTATDTVGNAATASVTFNVDRTAPVITITSPVAGNYLHAGMVSVGFNAVDPDSGVASVSATMDGAPIADGAIYSLLWTTLGPHTLAVTAVDVMGNSATQTVTFNVIASIESMIQAVNEFYTAGQIDNEGIQNSLLVKLAKYERDTGDRENSKNYLKNFINAVEAQRGKHITVAAADSLLADAAYCIAQLGG
jgi:N-acetylmuramoyl-L-alanine amidase